MKRYEEEVQIKLRHGDSVNMIRKYIYIIADEYIIVGTAGAFKRFFIDKR